MSTISTTILVKFIKKRKKKMQLNYGEALKEQRKTYGYTQNQIAKATKIPQQTISAYENNTNIPNIDFCVILADFYGITLDELVGRDQGREGHTKNVYYNNGIHVGNVKQH
jgi:transcriptional regulator with XRE-family HTH domain